MSKLIDNSSGVSIGVEVGNDVPGGVTPAILFIENIDGTDVIAEDHEFFGYTKTAGLYIYKESTVGFLQTPQAIDIRHTIKVGSSSFGIPSVVESLLTDDAGAVDSLGMSVYKASCEITHTSGTYTVIDMFNCAPSFTGSGTTSALRYFNAANYITSGTETISLVTGLYIGFSGSSNYGYYNSGTASNLLGITGSKTYQGSSLEVVMFYDSDGYWKFDQNTVAPLGIWVNSTGGQMDFIHSGDSDPNLLYSNSVNDTVGIGTNSSGGLGKLDIRPLLTNRTGLYMRIPSTPTVPYVLFQSSTVEDIFQIRRGPGQTDDLGPQMLIGKPTNNMLAIADSVFSTVGILTGDAPSIVLNSNFFTGTPGMAFGIDSGSQATIGTFLRADIIFCNDDVGDLQVISNLYVFATGSWTASSTPFKTSLLSCPTGSITPFARIGITSDDGVIINDSSTSDCPLVVKSPVESYLFYVDVSTDRVGIKTNTPSSNLEVLMNDASNNGIRVKTSVLNIPGEFIGLLNSSGNSIFRTYLNQNDSSDLSPILRLGRVATRTENYVQSLLGTGQIISGSDNSTLTLVNVSSSEESAIMAGNDSGVVALSNNKFFDLFVIANDTTTSLSRQTVLSVYAGGGWGSGDNPTRFDLQTTPDGSSSPVQRLSFIADGTITGNPTNVSTADFYWESAGSDYLLFLDSSANMAGILTNAPAYELDVNGTIRSRNDLRVGSGGAGLDYTIVFDGETSDGTIKWLEDEGIFQVNSCSTALPNSPLLSALSGSSYFSAVGTVAVLASISTTSLLSSSIYVGKSSGVAAGNNETLHQNIIYGNTGASTIAGNIYHSIVADDSAGWAVGSSGFRQDFWVVADGSSTPHVTPAITIRQNNLVGVQQSAPSSYFEVGGSVGFLATASSATSLTLADSCGYIFTGGSATTWTLPALSSNTNRMYFIKNRGSANITLQRAGSDQLYTTSAVNSITIAAGESYIIYNDATYWNIM